jgi:hypothetical protein
MIATMASNSRRRRQMTVWLHVLTSVGWMTLALVLFALLFLAATAQDSATSAGAPWVFAAAVLAPAADIAVGTALGFPSPFLSLVVVGVAVGVRRRTLREARALVVTSGVG